MKVHICLGTREHREACIRALQDSALWDTYFSDLPMIDDMFDRGFDAKEIHVALNDRGECIGYIWVTRGGCFAHFPYLRSFAVVKSCRNQGIGAGLLRYFEDVSSSNRFFLLVSELNETAQRFYERHGYTAVGKVPNLFKNGISEIILTKHVQPAG